MREGSLFEHDLPDGRNLAILPLTFERVRVLLSEDATTQSGYDSW